MRIAGIMVAALICVAIISLCGCMQQDPAHKVGAPAATVPRAITGDVYCLDGWEVISLAGDSVVYRHEHDVQEHLISCRGVNNG